MFLDYLWIACAFCAMNSRDKRCVPDDALQWLQISSSEGDDVVDDPELISFCITSGKLGPAIIVVLSQAKIDSTELF